MGDNFDFQGFQNEMGNNEENLDEDMVDDEDTELSESGMRVEGEESGDDDEEGVESDM